MPRDMQPFSDVVLLAIKAAMAPLQERLAAAEQSNRELRASLTELSGLRDRVTVMETKTYPEPQPVDLSPLLERLASAEARMDTLGDVRDRIVTIETKSAAPTVERRESGPTSADVELAIRTQVDPLAKEIAGLRERLAVVEVKPLMPGPKGEDGKDGKDGANGLDGKDGADGLGFDDLIAEQTDERSFTIKAQRGDRIKEIGTARFPVQIQRGTYVNGKTYDQGDVVTWDGSQWHCEVETSSRPGESKDWKLVVKRGRDGKDGKDAPGAPPVVSVRG